MVVSLVLRGVKGHASNSHLHESNKEDNSRKRINKEPMLRNSLRIEEKPGGSRALVQEIACEGGDPLEDGETGAGLEDEQCDGLLEEEPDDDGGPGDCCAVGGDYPEEHLEDEEAEDGYCAVAVGRALRIG